MSSSLQVLLDPEAFQAWKAHPLTQGFLKYLQDRRSDLMEAWAKGQAGSDSPEIQAQAVVLGQLARISFEDVARQYDPGWEPAEDAAALAERLKEESR